MLLKSNLPSTTRHVLLTLSCHVNDAGEPCYPSVTDLVAETGLSKRAVLTHLDAGREAGFIRVGRHGFSGQKWARNEYTLAWPGDDFPVDNTPEGGERGAPPLAEGGERGAPKAVNVVHHLAPPPYIRVFPSIPITPTPLTDESVYSGFDQWWALVPSHRKIAKAKCRRLWDRRKLEARAIEVMTAYSIDKASQQWVKDRGEFVPHPHTWLNEERYEREAGQSTAHDAPRCCRCGEAARYSIGHQRFCKAHFNLEPRT